MTDAEWRQLGEKYALYALCEKLNVPHADVLNSEDAINGKIERLAVRINEMINKRLYKLEKENEQLKEEARHAADILETVCDDCPDGISSPRICFSEDYCNVLSTCNNIRKLLGEDTDND